MLTYRILSLILRIFYQQALMAHWALIKVFYNKTINKMDIDESFVKPELDVTCGSPSQSSSTSKDSHSLKTGVKRPLEQSVRMW